MVEWICQRAAHRIPVVIDAAGQGAALIPALSAAKVRLVTVGTQDVCRATTGFCDDVLGGKLTHGSQPDLDAAVMACRKRPIGQSGAFGWDRQVAAHQAPLIAVTLARYGAVTVKPRTGVAGFF